MRSVLNRILAWRGEGDDMLVHAISLVLPPQNTRKVEVCLKTVPTVDVRPPHYQLLRKHTPPTKPFCVLWQSLQVTTNNKH